MQWRKQIVKPERIEIRGATMLANKILEDGRVDALSRVAVKEILKEMEEKLEMSRSLA